MTKAATKKAVPRNNDIVSIKCKVSLGMFPGERVVSVELPEGNAVTGFVDKNDVIVSTDPSPNQVVEGRVRVFVLRTEKDSVLVDLSQPALAQGTRFRVPKSLLE